MDIAADVEDMWQRHDEEQQEKRFYEIAGRLHSLVIDGKLDVLDFEDCLYAMGILTEWKRSKA